MMILRLTSEGRGTHYTMRRGVVESALRIAYRGDWPAALWQRFPTSCRVACIRHTLAILPPEAAPIRIGFVSDIHIGPTTPRTLLDVAFAHLAHANLDVLLLGGDYVFLDATRDKANLLSSLVARVPAKHKFAVFGNHDLWTHHAMLEEALTRAGVHMLCNESVRIDDTLTLVGLDEPWTGAIDAERAFRGVADTDAVVVLCHSPDGLPRMPASHVAPSLYVCGHTHGGHIASPWGPLIVPGRVGKKYPHGLHHVPPWHVHVSRGIGGIELPIRAYAPPEVAIFDLVTLTAPSRSRASFLPRSPPHLLLQRRDAIASLVRRRVDARLP